MSLDTIGSADCSSCYKPIQQLNGVAPPFATFANNLIVNKHPMQLVVTAVEVTVTPCAVPAASGAQLLHHNKTAEETQLICR